uniref:Uncharacterized protein n=1 Tax=Rhipicephalus zambeziensis TaxID=60191 RepID=A0A224Y998_9ACAR
MFFRTWKYKQVVQADIWSEVLTREVAQSAVFFLSRFSSDTPCFLTTSAVAWCDGGTFSARFRNVVFCTYALQVRVFVCLFLENFEKGAFSVRFLMVTLVLKKVKACLSFLARQCCSNLLN